MNMKNPNPILKEIIVAMAIFWIPGISSVEDELRCYDTQREFIERLGAGATLQPWFPKCLPGGYYLNVQCTWSGCFCAYLDTGTRIEDTPEDESASKIQHKCPWLSQTMPGLCAMPPEDYPCKAKMKRFYFNPGTGKCEESRTSCLGFTTLDQCDQGCISPPILCKLNLEAPVASKPCTVGPECDDERVKPSFNEEMQCECKNGYELLDDEITCVKKACEAGFVRSGDGKGCVEMGKWSAWGDWEFCNMTCGGGSRIRRRSCTSGGPSSRCPGQSQEAKDCNTMLCPSWAAWEEYGECTVTCGGGVQARNRICVNGEIGLEGCEVGGETDSKDCSEEECSESSGPTILGECSATCGGGLQIRVKFDPSTFKLVVDGYVACATHSCLVLGPCSSSPCWNEGECVGQGESLYTCVCKNGTKGDHCENIDPILQQFTDSSEAIHLQCVAPPSVTGEIIWMLDRAVIDETFPWLELRDGNRHLLTKYPHFTYSGKYTCQFNHKGKQYIAHTTIIIREDAQIACGGTPGNDVSSRTRGPRILGGRLTKQMMAPFVAMIYAPYNYQIKCVGSLVDTRHVVTAAHCFNDIRFQEVTVYLGKLESNVSVIERQQQSSNVTKLIIHPKYNETNYHADIAILVLEDEVYFSASVKPICVPMPNDRSEDTTTKTWSSGKTKYGIVYGWGKTEDEDHSRRLRELALPIVEQNKCQKLFKKHNITNDITDLMFCAGGQAGKDTCNGDSGGPFTLWSRDTESWYVGGITSWGNQTCGKREHPGVYTKLNKQLRRWIYDNTDLGNPKI